MHKPFSSLVIAIVAMSILLGCGMEEINSIWRDRKVVSDGIDDGQRWRNALHSMAKGDVTIGILNDEDALYVRLTTRNRAIQNQLLTAGFTVWFDETGGHNRMYGIRFPLPTRMVDPGSEQPQPLSKIREERNDPFGISDKLRQASQGDMEIIQPGKNEFNSIAAEYSISYGVQCYLRNMGDNFIYELRIPLIRSNLRPYGIAMSQTRTIGIGFETGKVEQQQAIPGDSGGRGPRGRGGSGGRRGSGGGTGGSSGGDSGDMGSPREMMKPINLWIKVNLAAKS